MPKRTCACISNGLLVIVHFNRMNPFFQRMKVLLVQHFRLYPKFENVLCSPQKQVVHGINSRESYSIEIFKLQ